MEKTIIALLALFVGFLTVGYYTPDGNRDGYELLNIVSYLFYGFVLSTFLYGVVKTVDPNHWLGELAFGGVIICICAFLGINLGSWWF